MLAKLPMLSRPCNTTRLSGFLIPEISEINMAMDKFVLNGTPQKITDGSKGEQLKAWVTVTFTLLKVQACPQRIFIYLITKLASLKG